MSDSSRRLHRCIQDLIELLGKKARADQIAKLTPETAFVVVAALRAYATQPHRNEVAMAVCRDPKRCTTPCFTCLGIANKIKSLYEGNAIVQLPPPGESGQLRVVGSSDDDAEDVA